MLDVNPEILVWTRESIGLTREEAVRKLGIRDAGGICSLDRLAALENGEVKPTRTLLVKMAKHYHQPILTFYLPEPPVRADRGVDFRTLPQSGQSSNNGLLDAFLRDIRVRQSMLRAVLEDEDEVDPLPFVGSKKMSDGRHALCESLKEILGVDFEDYRRQANARSAFRMLRQRAENAGIYVLLQSNLGSHHTAIEVDVFRGFVIADDAVPFIVINNRDAVPSWSFTLLHEMVHLILGQTAVSDGRPENQVEKFCNDVASEFLLPGQEIESLAFLAELDFETVTETVQDFAGKRNLSLSMVAYAAYRKGFIDHATWNRLVSVFRAQWERSREKNKRSGGPGYYSVRTHHLGGSLINDVQRMMHAGNLTTTKAAKILGVKPKNVQALFDKT